MKYFLILLLILSNLFADDKPYNLSLEEILSLKVSIGSRVNLKNIFQSPIPLAVITKEDLENNGFVELQSVIQRILPIFNSPRPSISDGTDHIYPFTLRGFAPDQVLVLINGKRKVITSLLHINETIGKGSTSYDLNVIPIQAIERIEILKDGASAQYGSDAIAGIINIILKEKTDNTLSYSYSQTHKNDGKTNLANLQFGNYYKPKDFQYFTLEFVNRERTNRSLPRYDLTGLDQHLNGKRLYRFGDADSRNIRFLSNISIDFEDFVFYTYGYINHRTGESSGYYRLPSQPRTLVKVYPDGFLPLIKPQIIEFNTVNGIKSNFSGWDSDFSFNYGKNIFQFNVSNSINASLGPNSPKEFYCGTLQYSHIIFTANFNKPIHIGFYMPANIAFGSVYRTENYMIIKGDEASYKDGNFIDTINGQIRKYPAGAQVFPGFMPNNETNKYKNNYSLYFDFEQNVLDNFLLGISLRYENYNDFGEKLNKKFAIRYEPISNLAIRSSISTGFKAPTLQQSYFTATSTNLIDGELYQVGTLSVNHPVAQSLGAKPLKPEKSNHFNVGLHSLQIPNTSVSIDFFNTTIKDRIIISGNFSNNPAKSSPYVINLLNQNKIGGAKFFTNAVDTRTYGIDLSLKNEFNFNEHTKFLSSLSYSIFKTNIIGNIKIPEQINDSISKKIFFNRLEIIRLTKAQPSNNIYINFIFTYRNFSIHTNLIKYGDIEYVFDVDNPALDKKFNGKFLIDLTFKYQLQNLIISFGSNNITNNYPDKKSVEPYLPYFDSSPFGFNGRTVFAKLSYKI